ncbi:MAG: hypothetical protein QF876_05480 [Desulfobacterales bacterium]|nr:hypothetical protein [Desulfobacterales bacterium]
MAKNIMPFKMRPDETVLSRIAVTGSKRTTFILDPTLSFSYSFNSSSSFTRSNLKKIAVLFVAAKIYPNQICYPTINMERPVFLIIGKVHA